MSKVSTDERERKCQALGHEGDVVKGLTMAGRLECIAGEAHRDGYLGGGCAQVQRVTREGYREPVGCH